MLWTDTRNSMPFSDGSVACDTVLLASLQVVFLRSALQLIKGRLQQTTAQLDALNRRKRYAFCDAASPVIPQLT